MARLFISYRREDTQYQADRLHAAIRPHVPDPARDIFIDIDNIPLGVNFAAYLDDKVSQCEVLLALIGPSWLDARGPGGQRRLDDPADFVRIEIASALKRGIPVVPVLFDGAPVPRPDQLPEDLKELSLRNGVEIRRASFETDAARLTAGLGLSQPGIQPAAPPYDPDIELQVTREMAEAEADLAWDGMEDSFDPGEYAYFLEAFPDHPKAGEARRRVRQLEAWHEVSKFDFTSIEAFRKSWERSDPLFPALEARTKKVMEDVQPKAEAPPKPARRLEAKQVKREAEADLKTDPKTKPATRSKSWWPLPPRMLFAILILNVILLTAFFWYVSGNSSESDSSSEIESDTIESAGQASDTRLGSGDLYGVVDTVEAGEPLPDTIVSGKGTEAEAALPPPEPQYRAGETFRDTLSGGGQGPEMVVIPAGSFIMGSPSGETGRGSDEGPAHTVRIGSAFAVGKYEVTWSEWEACVADGGCDNAGPLGSGGDNGWGRGKRPVILVSWNDAQAYASWLSRKTGEAYRLLTEAEWEYAARGVTTATAPSTRFFWGNEDPVCQRGARNGANYFSCSSDRTELVGFSAANAFGLHDMHGNVWEWGEDCYQDSHNGAPTDGTAKQASNCAYRVLRGGSWVDPPRLLRSALRDLSTPTNRDIYIGFRVARTL